MGPNGSECVLKRRYGIKWVFKCSHRSSFILIMDLMVPNVSLLVLTHPYGS